MTDKVSRRGLFKFGLGFAGGLAAASAQACQNTGRQPEGPFFPYSNTPIDPILEDPTNPIHLANDNDLTFIKGRSGVAEGQIVFIEGQVLNQDCEPIPDATLIIWQASSSGRYNHRGDSGQTDFKHPETGEIIQRKLDQSFQYWGKAFSDSKGKYTFKTIVPGFYPAGGNWFRPPHVHFMISATGYPQLVTQLYFKGEEIIDNQFIQDLNKRDLLLQNRDLTPEQRKKLVVEFNSKNGKLIGNFDITLTR